MERKRFIKSKDAMVLARVLGFCTKRVKKDIFMCCPSCDGHPLVTEHGWVFWTEYSPRELEREFGLKTSSSKYTYKRR